MLLDGYGAMQEEISMKRTITGGFLALIGSIWMMFIAYVAGNNLVSGWATPPGRFLTTVSQMGLSVMLFAAIGLMVAGLALMIVELFRKEK